MCWNKHVITLFFVDEVEKEEEEGWTFTVFSFNLHLFFLTLAFEVFCTLISCSDFHIIFAYDKSRAYKQKYYFINGYHLSTHTFWDAKKHRNLKHSMSISHSNTHQIPMKINHTMFRNVCSRVLQLNNQFVLILNFHHFWHSSVFSSFIACEIS